MNLDMEKLNIEEIIKKNIHRKIVIEGNQSEEYFNDMWTIWWKIMNRNIKEGLIDSIKEISETLIEYSSENARMMGTPLHNKKLPEENDIESFYQRNDNTDDYLYAIDRNSKRIEDKRLYFITRIQR